MPLSRNVVDCWVEEQHPSMNHADSKSLWVNNAAANTQYPLVYFSPPFRQGANIATATLRLYARDSWGGTSRTITVKRADSGWKAAKVDWNSKPGVTGSGAAVTSSASLDATEYAFDVTNIMQLVADGADWYGFRVETTSTTARAFYSSQALDYRPTLEVTWSGAPDTPTDLSPAGNRAVSAAKTVLGFRFNDGGDDALIALQVQQNATEAWGDPSFDSGTVTVSEPELDLSSFSYARSVSVTKTAGSATITVVAGTLSAADVGASITGTGIPGGTTITAATLAGTTATMSTGTGVTAGTVTATVTRTGSSLSNGSSIYWRVRVKDATGLWSAWSDAARYQRDSKGVLTITSPVTTVSEFTPPILWTFTGETQTAWRLIVADAADPTAELYDTGWRKGTAGSHTLPKGVLDLDTDTWRLKLRVRDAQDREGRPGDPAFVEAVKDFTYLGDVGTAPVTTFTTAEITPTPYVQLNWQRSTAPDSYTVRRDGKVVDSGLSPGSLLTSGTSYQYIDREAKPWVSHVWRVSAVVNGVASHADPTSTRRVTPTGVWLYDKERGIDAFLGGGADSSFMSGEQADTYVPIGAQRPVRITQGMQGWEGTISGATITDVGGHSADYWENQLLKIRSRPGNVIQLAYGKDHFPAVLGNIVIRPWHENPNPDHKLVDLSFWQVGNITYDAHI